MTRENWTKSYAEAPEVFDAFRRAEDPEGEIARRLAALVEPAERTVLELGAGTGRTAVILAPLAGRYAALEPEPAMLRIGRAVAPAAGWIRGRAEALPVATGSVDRVVATWFLANAGRQVRRAAIEEARRVLAPGGSIWAVENGWDDEFQALRGRAGPFEASEVRPLVEEHGFEIVARIGAAIRFGSVAEACRVLGWLVGSDHVPAAETSHEVLVLRLSFQDPRHRWK